MLKSSGINGVFFRKFVSKDGPKDAYSIIWLSADLTLDTALRQTRHFEDAFGLCQRQGRLGISCQYHSLEKLREVKLGPQTAANLEAARLTSFWPSAGDPACDQQEVFAGGTEQRFRMGLRSRLQFATGAVAILPPGHSWVRANRSRH